MNIKELRNAQTIEYLARIEYEAQMKYAQIFALPWSELSDTHKKIAKAGIRAVIEAILVRSEERSEGI